MQFGSVRIKNETRLVLVVPSGRARARVRVRRHAHGLADLSRRMGAYWPRGIRTYKPSRVAPNRLGPVRNKLLPFFATFTRVHTNACVHVRVRVDKQWLRRVSPGNESSVSIRRAILGRDKALKVEITPRSTKSTLKTTTTGASERI